MIPKLCVIYIFFLLCFSLNVLATHNVYYTILDDSQISVWNLNPDYDGNIILTNDGNTSSIGLLNTQNHSLIKYDISSGIYTNYDSGLPYQNTEIFQYTQRFYQKTPLYEIFIRDTGSVATIYKKTGSSWVASATNSVSSKNFGFSFLGDGTITIFPQGNDWKTYFYINNTIPSIYDFGINPVVPRGQLIEKSPSTATYLYGNNMGSYDGINTSYISFYHNNINQYWYQGYVNDALGKGFFIGRISDSYDSRDLKRLDKNLTTLSLNKTDMSGLPDCTLLLTDYNQTGFHGRISDFDCNTDFSECYAVGYDNETLLPKSFWFNGTACEYIDVNDVTFINKTPRSIAYIPETNEWYVSGNGFFYKFSTSQTTLPTSFAITLYDINSKTVVNSDGTSTVYVYPLYAGYPINGYYQISSNSVNNYFGVSCDYMESILVNDTFTYQNISSGGWTPPYYTTSIFDAHEGTSLYMNGSGIYVGDVKRALVPLSDDSASIKFLIRPTVQSGRDFSSSFVYLQDGLGHNIFRFDYDYNSTSQESCVYGYIPSRTLMYCISDMGNNWISNDIELSLSKQLYSMTTSISGNDDKFTAGLSPLITFSNIGYFDVGISDSAYDSYFDNLEVSQVTDYPSLTEVNSTLNITTGLNTWQYSQCDYSTIKCYKTRFYQQSTNTQAWNHFEDFDICSSQTQQFVEQLDQSVASFWNGLFGTDATTTQASRITTAIITMVITFLISLIALWVMLKDGKLATAISTVITSIMFVMFSITGFFPAWVVVLIIIFVSGVLMIFGRRIVTGG